MKVLIDTNVLISAALFPNSVPANVFNKVMLDPFEPYTTEQNILEFKKVINKKFPDKISLFNDFLSVFLLDVSLLSIPLDFMDAELKIRDNDDRFILRAALFNNIDIIVTGDKDFLESDISVPQILSPSDFLNFSI